VSDNFKSKCPELRGINVSGHKMIKMEALKTTLEAIGFQNVQIYIQSGNVFCGQRR